MLANLEGGSVGAVEAVSASEEFVKIDVVSDVVLLLLVDETGSGAMIRPGRGAVAPRIGTSREEEAGAAAEEAFEMVLACLRRGGFAERSG